MNTRHLVAAAALALLGTSAFAGGEFDPLTGFNVPATAKAPAVAKPAAAPASSAGLTREQVKAEFLKARAEGTIVSYDQGAEFAKAPTGPGRDREEVRAEARAAVRKSGS